MTQKFTLITTTTTGNKIQHFTNIRDWFIAFMQRELKVNSLGYLELLETDKTITLNLHDKATNQLILTLYHNSDITKGYILANGLYYFNQQDVVEDKKAKSKNKLAYQFGMPLAELKELYLDYTIFRYFFDETSNLDGIIDCCRIYFEDIKYTESKIYSIDDGLSLLDAIMNQV